MKARSFHPNADPRKDKENRTLFREVIEVAKEIWKNEYFLLQGREFHLPSRGDPLQAPPVPARRSLA